MPLKILILTVLWTLSSFGPLAAASSSDAMPEPPATASAQKQHPTWLRVDIGIIGTASEDILNMVLEEAERRQVDGIVVQLDTPGGSLESTRAMVKSIMGATHPVVVWVGPAGSRAGSAGTFITLSAHIAAMAPGTNIGAAHPVNADGQDIEGSEAARKITNDTLAFIESIAKKRHRNIEVARSFVATSASLTDSEALDHQVIDLVATNIPELLEKVDGRVVHGEGSRQWTLSSHNAVVVDFEKSLRQRLLEILSNPNLFYLLFMAGLIGIGYELTHPGIMLPGIAGGICMVLALIATSVLPVSFGAAALILAGVGMLIAEMFLPSFGVLGVGGLVSLVLGSVFLVDPNDTSGLRVSWYAIAPGVTLVGGAFLTLGWILIRSRSQPVRSGRYALIDSCATALADFENGRGQVRASGAIWTAHAPQVDLPIRSGDELIVKGIDGLTLEVRKP